jgi:hypothetical protein
MKSETEWLPALDAVRESAGIPLRYRFFWSRQNRASRIPAR